MNDDKLYFVTSNPTKFSDYQRRLSAIGIDMEQVSHELNEGRSLDIEEIARHKLDQAKELLPKKRIIVEDRGFFLPALKGFPGPFVKLFLGSIGIEGLLKLMENIEDRTAQFISVLAYWDGNNVHYFYDIENGFLISERQGVNLRNWTEILYVYGYPMFPGKSLAQYTDEEWSSYLAEIEKNDFVEKFINYLKNNLTT